MSPDAISILHSKNQIFNAQEKYMFGPMFGLYSFINICCGREELDDLRCSRRNMVEVAVAIKIVDKMYKAWIDGARKKLSIGIVSPYDSQICAIQEKLGHKYVNDDMFTVRARVVNRLEVVGGEEDVVILSTVRTNNDGSIDFISILDQWTDASPTMARLSLWVIGSEEALVSGGLEWESLIHNAKERKCFFNAEEDEDLAKLLAEVKRELHEFDALLSADCKLFENAKWKVMFSDDFRKSFVNLKSPHTKKLVTNLLLRLSCGWRPKRRNVDVTCARSKHILKQFKVKDLYVVCSVDIKRDSVYIQVLKVWDILPLCNVSNLVKRLDGIFATYHNDYLNRCRLKCFNGDLEVPMTWDSSSDIVRLTNTSNVDALGGSSHLEDSGVNESLSLMKFYSLSSGTARHLLSGCDGNELGIPFELNDEELEITRFNRSSFILGRSGTGKTTVLILKLIQREQLYHIASQGFHEVGNSSAIDSDEEIEGTILRQLFVTVSPKLCYAVKHNISKFQRFTCNDHSTEETSSIDMEDIDEAAQFRDIPDSFINLPSISYPLIITFHKFLMMLDGTLGRSYFDKFPEVRKFSQGENRRSVVFQTFIRVKEVSFEKFHSSYRSRFNQRLIKKLDSSVVYTEIISRIKGVVGEKRAFDSPLGLDEYLLMSKGQVSSLSETEKERVYEVFLQYERRKMELGEFDSGDLVMDLHKRFQVEKYNGDKIQFVYVDEVQDLNMRQIALFKYVCRNFDNGFVFSGDTAQTIAKGFDFRFEDIRALFYKEFTTTNSRRKGQIADIFQLRQNFRTHCGVLKLSQSILDLIYDFFPSSIDVLSPETSLVYGNAPVWLEPVNNEDNLESIFLNLSSSGRNMIGFGAEQVILVRDEHEKAKVLNTVGKRALVLTILECKGLEFQDVLLYNFFTSSPLENQWRVVYEYMERKKLLNSSSMTFPRLTDGKDIVLCSELKQLYVAITRTRQRLWIFENVEYITRPMFDFWSKLCLVQVKPLDHLNDKQVESSKEEWSSRGIKLFHQHNYEMAQMCFEKAGDAYMEKWADAASHRAKANQMNDSDPYVSRNYLKTAARMFDSIGKFESAAQCYIELNEYEIAGEIYAEKFGESRLEDAGDCFARAKCYELAACAYAKVNKFSKCLSACFNGKMLEIGLEYIKNWRQSCHSGRRMYKLKNSAQEFLEDAARHFYRLEDYTTMMKFVKAFDCKKSTRTFLTGLNRLDEILMLELQWGCFAEAAGVAKLKGDVLLEIDLLEKAKKFEDASFLSLNYVLCNSLFKSGSEGWPMKQFQNKNDLLTKAKILAKNVSDSFYQLVEIEAKVMSDKWNGLFEMNQCLRDLQRLGGIRGEIICARRVLDAHFDLEASKYKWDDREVCSVSKRLSNDQLSLETLIYFWDLWKRKIERVCEDKKDCYAEFGLGYFGVRKLEKDRLIMNLPDAHWARVIGKRAFKKKGNVITIDDNSFARAAHSYWSSELLSVGMKVVEVLKSLVPFSSTVSISRYNSCSKTLAYGFEVTQFVMTSRFHNRSFDQIFMLRRFSGRCVNMFFDSTFSIDCWKSMLEGMSLIQLRESERCNNLLEQVINRNINSSTLTQGKIGVVVTALLGASYMNAHVYGMISASFTLFPHWKEWIETYIESKEWEDSESFDHDLPFRVSLVSKLHKALQVSTREDWGAKFMSPASFLYILERLLVMVCYAYFDDFFFMTRAPFVEWLISENWCPGKTLTLEDDHAQILDDAIDFLIQVVPEIICNEKATREWIEEFSSTVEYVYQQLVLRLVVLVCVLCVNTQSKDHSNLVMNLLNREEVATKLPRQFYATLQRWERDRVDANVRVLVDACGKIGNPLVMVNVRRNCPNFSLPGAKFIDLQARPSRESMLQNLFS